MESHRPFLLQLLLQFVPLTLRYPRGLGSDVIVAQTRITLRGDDRRVAENLLKGSQATTPFQPHASERVPQLMRVKPLYPALLSNHTGEGPAGQNRVRNQPPDPAADLSKQLGRERHPPHFPGLRLRHDEHASLDVTCLRPAQLAPPQARSQG